MLYDHCLDDTLVLVIPEDLSCVYNALNNFDRNLMFTLDTNNAVVSHYLDIEIHPDGLGSYCKCTNTGQYTHYASFFSWRYKTA